MNGTEQQDLVVATQQSHSPAVIDRGLTLSTAQVIERTKKIREVMEAVMKPNVHYGVIPGTPKPTMYQPGADVLNVTFRITAEIAKLEDLSSDDDVRYRVTVHGVHQVTGEKLAEGVGECSSNEEKYRWRKAVCDEEWNEAPGDRRRDKWGRGQGGKTYKAKQIRTSPADVANTVLKMAVKRAKVAMTIAATAASDVFAQDLEDLSDELREHLTETGPTTPGPQPAQRKSEQAPTPAATTATTSATQPASSPAPAAAPAKSSPPKPIGIITAVDEKGTAALITLDTGFKCSTRNPEFMTAAAAHRDAKRRVELVTRASSDPTKYAPILDAIEPVAAEDTAQ
jgi:hypothetical protein